MNKNNHEDNTNKARHNIHEYAQKNSEKYIKKIDEMRSSKEKMTFKNSVRYLWSLIVLGINWMVYKKVVMVLLTAAILVGALVWSPPIGLILCLLTPIFLGMYGKYFYFSIEDKYQSIEKQRLLIPSSLLITWILIIFVFILLIISFIEKLI
ncbi:Protein of unknown function (DUF2628) [Romboutsia ilealis]|uniref:Uncharacterized protein n=1 Tax=Romboutsia ilealis TaxID=1115758 RepID=A0A1V1I424_9FIRM|nr:hypothetical protein [Romboutsia ilealis]CED94174.1 Protein of unknown function (DUF2628) [Romboutsia ilealis]